MFKSQFFWYLTCCPNYSTRASIKTISGTLSRCRAWLNISFEIVNLGGGIGIPYRPEEKPLEIELFAEGVRKAYEEIIVANKLDPLRVVMEVK